MKLLSRLRHKLYALEELLNEPAQFKPWRRGVQMDIYRRLNRAWLRSMKFGTILDIGANVGQFALAASAAFPEARIYSFEPLPECYRQLVARLNGVATFSAFNLGIGEKKGCLSFDQNAFSASSSFLKMTQAHRKEFPHTRDFKSLDVNVERLDQAIAGLEMRKPILIKIDVQGYEDKVIAGGENTIRQADLIIVEVSFESLYEGQPLFEDVYRLMAARGFVYRGSLDQLQSSKDGRPLQIDGIFVKQRGVGHI